MMQKARPMPANTSEDNRRLVTFSSSSSFFPLTFSLFITVLSQWDFSHGKFGLRSLGKASCDRVALSNLRGMLGVLTVSIIHRTLIWTTGS